jgi:hypothetical protein
MTTPPTGEFVYSPKLLHRSIVRKQIARDSLQIVGINIKSLTDGDEEFTDPDPGSMTLAIYQENVPITDTPPGTLIITASGSQLDHPDVGLFTYTLQPSVTSTPALLTAVWSYTVQSVAFSYTDYYEIVDPMPIFFTLTEDQKFVVEQTNWMIGDLFDSTDGGPHLVEEFQTKFNYERLAQLLYIACQRINYESIPLTHFAVGNQIGSPIPPRWHGILQYAHYIQVLKHLARSYVEQPELSGIDVAFSQRRDYAQRWQSILDKELPNYTHSVRMFKRKMLNLGSSSMIVSGGIYGRNTFFRSSYSAQARSMRFYPLSWVGSIGGMTGSH